MTPISECVDLSGSKNPSISKISQHLCYKMQFQKIYTLVPRHIHIGIYQYQCILAYTYKYHQHISPTRGFLVTAFFQAKMIFLNEI